MHTPPPIERKNTTMFKYARTAFVSITTAGLALGVAIAPIGSAQAIDSHQHRTVVKLQKKETDSAITVINRAYETDVTDTVLQQLGLSADNGWEICRVKPFDPENYSGAWAYTHQNRLYVGAWRDDMKEGDTQLIDTELVQACTESEITEPQRLSILDHQPFLPELSSTLTKGHRCRVTITNRDDFLVADMTVSVDTKGPFFFNRSANPGTSAHVRLPRKAPQTANVYQSLRSADYSGSYLALDTFTLDTKTCRMTLAPYPVPMG